MENLSDNEEKILKELFPDKRHWFRKLFGFGIADKPLRRSLKRLQELGYIGRDEPAQWKQGMKKYYYLLPKGRCVASRLLIGEKGRDLFIRILEKLVSIAELYDDEGEKVAELALDIVNMLDDKEKSIRFRDALIDLIRAYTL